jgi:hypothetical protein
MRRYAPVLVLFILSPLIAEFLFGATPVSNLPALLPGLAVYGGGAVLIRELVRRRGPGWGRIALLGAAYAIVEEGLALQSMFNPDLFKAGIVGGRAFGVNWIWSEWTVGYHMMWSILIPILLAEMLFPDRRSEPWLGRVGVTFVGIIYALGVLTYAAIFRFVVAPNFQTPAVLLFGAVLVVVGLVGLALGWPSRPTALSPVDTNHSAPSPWLVGLVALLTAGAWFSLLDLPHVVRMGPMALLPLLLGVVVAGRVIALLKWWSVGPGWTDMHRLALILGALLISVLWGFFFVTAGHPIDQLVQGVASGVTLILLALFARQLQQRNQVVVVSAPKHT